MIPYGRQNITEADINSVVDILKSSHLTQGTTVPDFEKSVCDFVDAKYGVATNSATSALHLAVMSLGLKSSDTVWTSAISFVASANCASYCGAKVDFVDIEPNSFNICPSALNQKLIDAELRGELPKILIVVHMAGQSAEMDAVYQLSRKYGFKIIEDASHALGGTYGDSNIGNCTYSDITIFSFHPVKIITTGEGGMAVTNQIELAKKMQLLRSHGVSRDPSLFINDTHGDWYYEMLELGFNYRLTDIQAALGIEQLKRLTKIIEKRNYLAKRYDTLINRENLLLPEVKSNRKSSFHLYIIRLKNASNRKKVFDFMRKSNIGVNVHYIPIHMHPYYQSRGFEIGDFPNAEDFYSRSISIPIFPELNTEAQNYVIDKLQEAFL